MAAAGKKMRVALPLGRSALGLAGLALAEGLGWLYLGLIRDVDDMVRSTIAQFMGTLPLFIGLGIFSFRRACDLDRQAGLVTKWWSLLWPWSRHVFDLSLFDKVMLRQEAKQLGSRRRPKVVTEYPVRLEGEKRLVVRLDLPEDKARALAEGLDEYLGLHVLSTLTEKREGDEV